MNRSDDGLLERPGLVTRRAVNCVMHDGILSMYESYPESKFRWAIKKKTRIYYKPCILPFDVQTVHYFST